MDAHPYVILGGGMVAGYAAKELSKSHALQPGELMIVTAEEYLPYERPPLSKSLLAGKKPVEKVFINNESFYRENRINVRLGTTITFIDPSRNLLRTDSGEEIFYKKLIIATGARVRRFQLPGASLGGIHYLRSLADCLSLRSAAEGAKRAVVIGADSSRWRLHRFSWRRTLKLRWYFRGEGLASILYPANVFFFRKIL